MISVREAGALIGANVPPYGAEACPLSKAHGRILRETIVADRAQPPFNRVTMDGIAFRYQAWEEGAREFSVEGAQPAGIPENVLTDPSACFEVMTGAVLPVGCDCIVPVEHIEMHNGVATVQEDAPVTAGRFIHESGSDYSRGDMLLEAGGILTPPRIALAASTGKAVLQVARVPSIAVVSTGDELVDVDGPVAAHQVRRSNSYAIRAMLANSLGCDAELVHLPDDFEITVKRAQDLVARHDVVILAGGVSMGRHDHVPGALERAGVTPIFHRVRQRPGKPMWFGISSDGKPVFALPGNPVSATVCAARYILPHLLRAMGLTARETETASLGTEVPFKSDLTYFLPVRLHSGEDGRTLAKPCPTNTSGDYATLGLTDGFLELEAGMDLYPEGHVAQVHRWVTQG
jgi:molybdopterin molybdotransferase